MDMAKIRKRFIPMSETMCYILLSLRVQRHGYGVMQYVKELTNNRILLGAGTIYQSMGKLEQEGLIVPIKEEDRKKIYQISPIGTQILQEEAARIREINKILEELL